MIFCLFFFYIFLYFSLSLYFSSMFLLYWNCSFLIELNLLTLNSVKVEVVLYLDWISLMFSSFVMFISSMIMVYSLEYMEGDSSMKRFIFLMLLFILSMLVVIMSSNLVFILLGWDGLGLVSYALVIYYQNLKSYNAGMLTALSNRIGDGAILLSIVLLMDLGSWNYHTTLDSMSLNRDTMILSLLIILASFTKSAQIPFSAWLPAAMAAPTPVSSLVHSSTLVTAGVYLLFRFADLMSEQVKLIFMTLSLLTMFMAGLAANLEYDLKKIIALSTLSQLGMMMVVFFLGNKDLAFFHLLMHALFKALLFMCAGIIIHMIGGLQDIRYMGGLSKIFPFTCTCFSISNMALCGLPFLSGFYSKDLIVEVFSMKIFSMFIYLIFFISIGLTVSYSIRLMISVFIGQYNMFHMSYANESSLNFMLKSLFALVLLVIMMGSLMSWISFSTPVLIVLPFYLKIMTLIIIVISAVFGNEISKLSVLNSLKLMSFYQGSMFVSSMWNIPVLSTSNLNSFSLSLGKFYTKNMDYGWTEFYGSKGLYFLVKTFTKNFQLFSKNHLKIFLLIMWGFFMFLVFLMFL
uniref:NADH-ubiquinone oxidoreductase chain 5 n=1 Tax=Curculionidae sp. 3 AH-2016 TaxID=1903829 RepID=A0A343C2Q0_9CUCU|nr:NADH dehydrogenase subunit 5 [Curculionidae sp. 3 AH-2016]